LGSPWETEPVCAYERVTRVVWRQGADRVLVARLDGDSADLVGAAALLWLALDEPRTIDVLAAELAEFGVGGELLGRALEQLLDAGLLKRNRWGTTPLASPRHAHSAGGEGTRPRRGRRVVTDLATHLARRRRGGSRGDRTAGGVAARAGGRRHHRAPAGHRPGGPAACSPCRPGARRAYDVVHGHGPVPTTRRLLAGRRAVGTIHSMWGALRRPSRWAVTALCGGTRLIAVSATAREAMPRRLRRTTTVIPHGVDLAAVDAAVAAAADAPTHGRDHVELLTVASHRREKNYANLLDAVAIADGRGANVRLRAIGEGPRLEAHRALAAQLGIDAIVAFEAPRPGVLGDIAATDMFVLASDNEGQPIVLTEALACGRPVVATTVGRAPELVTAEVGILVPTGDPAALAGAICTLAADPERCTRHGRRRDGRHRVGARWRHRGPPHPLP
jgi:glycosyltransferase involved in cell wall biosynthesis